MDPNNPKFEAFQNAVREALAKRLRDADEELARLRKENCEKEKNRENETIRLHQTQKMLKQEQRKLKIVEQDLHKVSIERQILEDNNSRDESHIQDLVYKVINARAKNDELQRTHNNVLMRQILLTSRRVSVAGDVNSSQTNASKSEEHFKKLQELKSAQDLYLDKLSQDMEDLEQKCIDYEAQTDAMRHHTSDMEEIIRSAERESEKVCHDKSAIMQRWTTSVINIAKRDEALVGFREAMKSQELELKGIKAVIEGTKSEIISYQEKHGHLTTINRRTERLCGQRRMQIKKTEEFVEDAKNELEKAIELLKKTMETLQSTETELKSVSREVKAAQNKIETYQNLRRELEGEVFLLSQDQQSSDKSTQNALKAIHLTREKIKGLEDRVTDAQNSMAATMQEIIDHTNLVESQSITQKEMEHKLSGLQKEIEVLDASLVKAQAEIDKKQHIIEIKLQEKTNMIESGKAISPLEAEVSRLQEELEAVTAFCNEAKQTWLKYQNEYISLLDDRSHERATLADLIRKQVIMQEKNNKLQKKINAMDHTVNVELKRKIEVLHQTIGRLQRLQTDEKVQYTQSVKSVEDRRALEINQLQLALDEVEAVKSQVHIVSQDINNEKREAFQAADALADWEEKVKTCKKTQNMISQEKDPRGELAHLKSEVHRLQLRSEQVDRATKVLISAMENYVGRREGLVDKAVSINLVRQERYSKIQMTKSLVTKKLDDLKNKVRKLCKEEKEIRAHIEDLQSRDGSQQVILEDRQLELKGCQEELDNLKTQIEKQMLAKERSLNLILQFQTRAKWYRAIMEKKYRLTMKESEDTATTEIIILQNQNKNLIEMLSMLQEQFPGLKRNLKRAASSLLT